MLNQTSRNRKSLLNALASGVNAVAGVEVEKRNKAYAEHLNTMEQNRRERILAIQNDNNLAEWEKRKQIATIEAETDKYVADKSQHRSMTHIKIGDGQSGGGSRTKGGDGLSDDIREMREEFNKYYIKQRNDFVRRNGVDEAQAEYSALKDAYKTFLPKMTQYGDTKFLDAMSSLTPPKEYWNKDQLNQYIALTGLKMDTLHDIVPIKTDVMMNKLVENLAPSIYAIDKTADTTYTGDKNPLFKNLDPSSRRAKIRAGKGKGIITLGNTDNELIEIRDRNSAMQYILDRMNKED
jgi:hypothetical protein